MVKVATDTVVLVYVHRTEVFIDVGSMIMFHI